jgi:hypothetical protein
MRWLWLLLLVGAGCSDRSDKAWRPSTVSGPLEVRQLPSTNAFLADYQQWVGSGVKVRVYEARLHENVSTNEFRYAQSRHKTPVGRPIFTTCEFHSSEQQYRGYNFEFSVLGKFPTNIFDFTGGKIIWVRPIGTNSVNGLFRLQIVGIEGTSPFGTIVAGED